VYLGTANRDASIACGAMDHWSYRDFTPWPEMQQSDSFGQNQNGSCEARLILSESHSAAIPLFIDVIIHRYLSIKMT
jgi:hypothetical protein